MNPDEIAHHLAVSVARMARVNTQIDRVQDALQEVGHARISFDATLEMPGLKPGFEQEDDMRLAILLLKSIEDVEQDTEHENTDPTSMPKGVAKRPLRRKTIAQSAALKETNAEATMLKLGHCLRLALQTRFPLTWERLLEQR